MFISVSFNTIYFAKNYTVYREKGVDKEDFACYNVVLTVALGLCAAVASARMLQTL